MILRVYIQCVRHRKTRAALRKFTNDSIQQPGTYAQQAHAGKSVKYRSHAASKKFIADDDYIDPDSSFSRSSNQSKCTTTRPIAQEDFCYFSISMFCHLKDLKWYLCCASSKLTYQLHHKGHMQVCPDHLSSRLNHIPVDIDEFIINHLYDRLAPAVIINLIKQTFSTTLIEDDLYKYRNKVSYTMLDDTPTNLMELLLID